MLDSWWFPIFSNDKSKCDKRSSSYLNFKFCIICVWTAWQYIKNSLKNKFEDIFCYVLLQFTMFGRRLIGKSHKSKRCLQVSLQICRNSWRHSSWFRGEVVVLSSPFLPSSFPLFTSPPLPSSPFLSFLLPFNRK